MASPGGARGTVPVYKWDPPTLRCEYECDWRFPVTKREYGGV